jgi:hypothetical protein
MGMQSPTVLRDVPRDHPAIFSGFKVDRVTPGFARVSTISSSSDGWSASLRPAKISCRILIDFDV